MRAALLVLLLSVSVVASAGFPTKNSSVTVNSTERAITVQFKDGRTEQYRVKWTATANVSWREEGEASTFFHPIDDRQCHWTTSGAIHRQMFMMSALGMEFAQKELEIVYTRADANKGSDFVLVRLHSENCGEANARRESDFRNMHDLVYGEFNATVSADLSEIRNTITENGNVLKITGL